MRAFTKLALILALLSSLMPRAHAQNIGGVLVQQAEQAIINGITTQVGKSLGAGSPLLLDQHSAFAPAPDLVDFHPLLLNPTASDLARHLPPGDYAIPVTGYCTQYSIHAPGRGLGYKLARVQGTQASAISALLVQGSLQGVSPYTLNADAWRIQAGVPLRQWSAEDQAMIHRLIPRHEKELQGDFLQQLQATYDDKSVIKFLGMKKRIPGMPSFEALLGQMGDVGKTVMRLEAARQILTNRTVSAERLPDMLFEPQGDGLPRVLPPSSDPSPSPWAEVQPGVFARYTILDGNMGRNLYEFRVTPDAVRQAKAASDGAATPHLITVASGPAPPSTDGPTLGAITGMGDASGEGASLNIGYSIGQGAQALIAVPILSPPTTDPQPSKAVQIVVTPKPNDVLLGTVISGTAVPEDTNGNPVPGLTVTIHFMQDGNDLGSVTATGPDYTFSFIPPASEKAGNLDLKASTETASASTPAQPNKTGTATLAAYDVDQEVQSSSVTGQATVTVEPSTANLTPDDFRITDIPGIMRQIANKTLNDGFNVAANMQDKWFNGLPTSPEVQEKEDSLPIDWDFTKQSDTTCVLDMNWIIARSNSTDANNQYDGGYIKLYNNLLNNDYLFSQKKDKNGKLVAGGLFVLVGHIRKAYKSGEVGVKFPSHDIEGSGTPNSNKINITEEIHKADQIQISAFDGVPPLNPVGMTLGDFSFYAIPIGMATLTKDKIHIVATKVGIYVVKGFRFHDHPGYTPMRNFLGSWQKPDQVSSSLVTPFNPLNKFHSVYEQDYLEWRQQTQKDGKQHGNDFLIISDIQVVSLPEVFVTDVDR